MKLFILIISYKSLPKLERCINSIGKNRNILIIENSNNFEIKKIIEKKFDRNKMFIDEIKKFFECINKNLKIESDIVNSIEIIKKIKE